MIKYKKGSIFDIAPEGSILVHACNAQGVWGSGIAKEFRKRFPKSFSEYNEFAKIAKVGDALLTDERIGCLFTSNNYGILVDSPESIVHNTRSAILNLLETIDSEEMGDLPIYSNKFNSGLFNVPWEQTEAILKYYEDYFSFNWIVCEL